MTGWPGMKKVQALPYVRWRFPPMADPLDLGTGEIQTQAFVWCVPGSCWYCCTNWIASHISDTAFERALVRHPLRGPLQQGISREPAIVAANTMDCKM